MNLDPRFTRRTVLATALATPLLSRAQAFPSKAVKIIVPYPPGGATDILGRLIAVKLQEAWGQTVVVENKPGASGVLGNDLVAKSPPDGYTVLLGITAIVQGATLFPKLPYDPYKDFAPVSLLSSSTSGVIQAAGAHGGRVHRAGQGRARQAQLRQLRQRHQRAHPG